MCLLPQRRFLDFATHGGNTEGPHFIRTVTVLVDFLQSRSLGKNSFEQYGGILRGDDGNEYPSTLLALIHEARTTQFPNRLRNRGLRHPESLSHLTHTQFTRTEKGEDT